MSVQKQQTKRQVITEGLVTFSFFLTIGIVLWQLKSESFFLFNFGYIGFAAATGEMLFGLLPRSKKHIGRKVSQLLIGVYMLGVLGFLGHENMQLEGFFFYLLAGTFSGPVLHYLIAKVGGTFLFGRGWCSWACWTTMVLDFFPWNRPAHGRLRKWGAMRYLHFFLSLMLVLVLWFLYDLKDFDRQHTLALRWLLWGNLLYFAIAILLAILLKDNRAFCKYVCPIPVLMKWGARFSVWKIEIDKQKCTQCRRCESNCPMNIQLLTYLQQNQRILSSECIACQTCVHTCPEQAIAYTRKFDWGVNEHLLFRSRE